MKAKIGRLYKHNNFPTIFYMAINAASRNRVADMVVFNRYKTSIKLCSASILTDDGEFVYPDLWEERSDIDIGAVFAEALSGVFK